MVRDARSNLIKLLFADESVVSSTICDDPANQNQIQSQELTNLHRSQEIDISEDDNVNKSKTVKVLLTRNQEKENVISTQFTNINISSKT